MDKTVIYYFSGTGNSLVVASDIAEKMDGELIPIHSVVNEDKITPDEDIIGIVFPVYYLGTVNIPLIVQRFVLKLHNIDTKYIFAACTYGGGSGSTLKIMDEMLAKRGGRLAAGFGIQMPQNAFKKPFENKKKLYDNWKNKKLDFIYNYIKEKNRGHIDNDGLLTSLVINSLCMMMKLDILKPFFINPMKNTARVPEELNCTMDELIPYMDRSYQTDENCIGCSTCFKICPVCNIKMVDSKPVWLNHCENCLACIKWCQQKAIHGYGELPRSYHHPDIGILDMMRK